MNIVDKIIQDIFGGSGADAAAERKKPVGAAPDNSGRIWKKFSPTPKEKERARAAYLKITADGYAAGDNFNADNGFNDSLLLLDSFDALQKKRFMKICRELAESCYNEKDFYDKNRRGCLYDYVSESFGKPDLSVMRDISPKEYPKFLAVCAASGNGCMREEAQRLAAEYPILLSIIISGFNDNVKEVRTAAENSFKAALDKLAGAFEENSDRAIREIIDPLIWKPRFENIGGDELRHLAMAGIFRTRRVLSEISGEGGCDPERLAYAETRLDEFIVKNLNEGNIRYLSESDYLPVAIGWFGVSDILCVYGALFQKELITYDTARFIMAQKEWNRVKDRAVYMKKLFRDFKFEQLVPFAFYPERITRRCAATCLFEEYGLWEGAEKALCDPASIVRETAVYYFEKLSDIDLHGFYMGRLPEISAMGGLARCSRTDEQKIASAKALRPLINSKNGRTAAAAVSGLAAVDGSDSTARELYELIKDPRPKVSKAALRAFLKAEKPMDCKQIYGDILKDAEGQKKILRELHFPDRIPPEMLSITSRRLAKALIKQRRCTAAEKLPWALRLCVSENDDISRRASIYIADVIKYDLYHLCHFYEGDMEEIRQALEEIRPKKLGGMNRRMIGKGLEEMKKKGIRRHLTDFSELYEQLEAMTREE